MRGLNPLDNPRISALKAQLAKSPASETIKSEIRQQDLQIRKAYFVHRDSAARGTALLFIGLAVLFLTLEIGRQLKKEEPPPIAALLASASISAARPGPPAEPISPIQSVSVFALAVGIVMATFSLPMNSFGRGGDPAVRYLRLALRKHRLRLHRPPRSRELRDRLRRQDSSLVRVPARQPVMSGLQPPPVVLPGDRCLQSPASAGQHKPQATSHKPLTTLPRTSPRSRISHATGRSSAARAGLGSAGRRTRRFNGMAPPVRTCSGSRLFRCPGRALR